MGSQSLPFCRNASLESFVYLPAYQEEVSGVIIPGSWRVHPSTPPSPSQPTTPTALVRRKQPAYHHSLTKQPLPTSIYSILLSFETWHLLNSSPNACRICESNQKRQSWGNPRRPSWTVNNHHLLFLLLAQVPNCFLIWQNV